MKVSDIMVKNPVIVDPNTSCGRIARIMRDKKIGSVILADENGKPVGIVTERDLVHRVMALEKDPDMCFAHQVSSKPVVAVGVHADVDMVVDLMNDYKIRRIVIVDEKDKIVGIVTTDDLSKGLREMSEELAVKYHIIAQRLRS
ncbi:MAG: CBS domain-containing protein [Candidatus Bathyarchaeota archaeon]|nr:CBS domain-containing protein [Candidatus Bathyarchaeota archaeon]